MSDRLTTCPCRLISLFLFLSAPRAAPLEPAFAGFVIGVSGLWSLPVVASHEGRCRAENGTGAGVADAMHELRKPGGRSNRQVPAWQAGGGAQSPDPGSPTCPLPANFGYFTVPCILLPRKKIT